MLGAPGSESANPDRRSGSLAPGALVSAPAPGLWSAAGVGLGSPLTKSTQPHSKRARRTGVPSSGWVIDT